MTRPAASGNRMPTASRLSCLLKVLGVWVPRVSAADGLEVADELRENEPVIEARTEKHGSRWVQRCWAECYLER